jgi:hypothetical protein
MSVNRTVARPRSTSTSRVTGAPVMKSPMASMIGSSSPDARGDMSVRTVVQSRRAESVCVQTRTHVPVSEARVEPPDTHRRDCRTPMTRSTVSMWVACTRGRTDRRRQRTASAQSHRSPYRALTADGSDRDGSARVGLIPPQLELDYASTPNNTRTRVSARSVETRIARQPMAHRWHIRRHPVVSAVVAARALTSHNCPPTSTINRLGLTSKVAMRVRFPSPAPPNSSRFRRSGQIRSRSQCSSLTAISPRFTTSRGLSAAFELDGHAVQTASETQPVVRQHLTRQAIPSRGFFEAVARRLPLGFGEVEVLCVGPTSPLDLPTTRSGAKEIYGSATSPARASSGRHSVWFRCRPMLVRNSAADMNVYVWLGRVVAVEFHA